ncbi:hypothetical protein JW906_07150, partial [bacterium]|nr:hypothetical protein [bacterium]
MMNEKKFLKALQWPAGAFILVFWIPLLFSQQPVRKPVKKPVQKPVQQPVQQPVQPPAQQTVQQPVQKTVQKKAVEKKLEIQSFDRKELSLKAGGDAAIIIVNGRNLDLVKSVRVVLNGNPVDEI